MEIIKADITHIKEAARLFDNYRMFYNQESDVAAAEKFLYERMVAGESTIFLALEDAVAVGFMQLYPGFSSVSMERIVILNDLYVDKKYRGKGVGQALVREVEKFAREKGVKKITLSTAESNKKAQSLYEGEGFVKGEFLNYFKVI